MARGWCPEAVGKAGKTFVDLALPVWVYYTFDEGLGSLGYSNQDKLPIWGPLKMRNDVWEMILLNNFECFCLEDGNLKVLSNCDEVTLILVSK